MVERLDEGVGAILAALEERGFHRDTVVIFVSDNGPTRIGRAAPFSGHKSGLYEGGIRVPCLIRWPGRLPSGMVADHVTATMDLTASMVRIAGSAPPEDRPFDGIDIIRQLQESRPPASRALFWRARRGERTWRAVRDGTTKYLSRQDGDAVEEHLFDLAADPAEKRNLLEQRRAEAERLKGLLATWEVRVEPQR
jgi:N-acetylgalactosamine-6-sulfatase